MRKSVGAFGLTLAVVVGAGLGWSGRELLGDPAPVVGEPSFTLVEVAEDSVQRSFNLAAAAQWSGGASVRGAAAGTVTAVSVGAAASVGAGDVVYDVDLRPVVIAAGEVPSFRELKIGVRGADVTQFQELLRAVKVRSAAATGVYDLATANETYAWKKALGLPPDGVVEAGRVIFVPRLPARIALDPQVRVGAAAPVGAAALRVLPREPAFSITLPTGQAALVRSGQAVTLSVEDLEWEAQIGEMAPPAEDGSVLARLEPPEGADSVCGQECDRVPVAGASGIPATIVVVPRVSGPVVPTSALRVGAGSATEVIDEAGTAIPVTIVGSAGGLAVVDGVSAGTRIRVPAGTAP